MLAMWNPYLLNRTWCSFSINYALRVALAILRHLNLHEGDSISTRTFSYLSTTLTAAYPPQSSTIDAAYRLLKDIHHVIISMPVSLLEQVVFAIQTGLAVWVEDKYMALSTEHYNDIVSNSSFLFSSSSAQPLLSQLMPLYDSLLLRLQSLPISVTSLNALVPLLTAAFSRIPPPALGPAAFQRFFYAVHARLAAPSDSYSDELRLCVDAFVRICGGEWPSGMVPLSSSSQTQTQFQMESHLTTEAPAPRANCEDVREQDPHVRSIEVIVCARTLGFSLNRSLVDPQHEVIPDSQCVVSNATSSQSRLVPGFVQGPSRSLSSTAQTRPDSSKDSHKSDESARSHDNSVLKKRRLPQDLPAAKRHCAAASPNNGLRTRSVPLTRVSSPVVPSPRSLSTPRASSRNRLVMDCVEVTPLRKPLHLREAGAQRHSMKGQERRCDLDDHTWEVTPERPFMARTTRELVEGDEIGTSLAR